MVSGRKSKKFSRNFETVGKKSSGKCSDKTDFKLVLRNPRSSDIVFFALNKKTLLACQDYFVTCSGETSEKQLRRSLDGSLKLLNCLSWGILTKFSNISWNSLPEILLGTVYELSEKRDLPGKF